ncbi:unnamed protein product [Clonostachys chloroleuca]|uniref:Xylanolytic transcriptional activator regulatory domain-containing protein n=1 Tax=Clonostachys chloroleuca TaxID=1926264 RepID=A0AA35Q9W2_9HYPO|nr:unnamed protein product [Clonostachys chloroleuca]
MSKRPHERVNGSSPALHPSKRYVGGAQNSHNGHPLPQISRNIKACTIKCLMSDAGPPCQRCHEKKLDCVVSKNLQSIIDEKTQLSEAVLSDLEYLYAAVGEMREAIGMPGLLPMQITQFQDGRTSGPTAPTQSLAIPPAGNEAIGPSCDNSPKLSPNDSDLPHIPIHSLYTLTKMRALRSPDSQETRQTDAINDFISHGKLALNDAERLFTYYRDTLDGFMYSIGCRYQSLDELRRKSPILSAATLTVAAMHDPSGNEQYGVCRTELRKLVERSMLGRQADKDYFRALSIAAYWLSDLSWTLSGHAIRRATECNIHNSFSQAVQEQSQDAVDCARIWSILYICDQHLATLYSRPAIIQDDGSTQNWEGFLNAPFATKEDERLMSQVELMGITQNIRQLFGPDSGQPIPKMYLNQISHYNRQLGQWIAKWNVRLPAPGFPRKGAQLHMHFVQLYLYSHVFRGQSSPLPSYFFDAACVAVAAASTIMEFLLTDPDLCAGIVGMPSYLLSMIAFTAMFAVKVAHKFKDDNLLTIEQAQTQILRLVTHFRSLNVGKWHLANLMVEGLEKLAKFVEPTMENGFHPHDGTGTFPMHTADGMAVFAQTMPFNHVMPKVDGIPCPALDTTFGLSPIFGFDPSWLEDGTLGEPMPTHDDDSQHMA